MALWDPYVFRRGLDVFGLWDDLFLGRKSKLLYITGSGFDTRVVTVLRQFLECAAAGPYEFEHAHLLMIGFEGYELDEALVERTKKNTEQIRSLFEPYGSISEINLSLGRSDAEGGLGSTLRAGTVRAIEAVRESTDVILDVSTLPRVLYLSLLSGLLSHLVRDRTASSPLYARGVNFQVLVAENATLDSNIRSEDPGEGLVHIPGYGAAVQADSMKEWPLVWFPLLGEHRVPQFRVVKERAEIGDDAEICPIIPHPSRDPRRPDRLVAEYRAELFDKETPLSNVILAHESQPFEAYRQILGAMERYRQSFEVLGGCRQLVTPFASKLMTLASGLACFEMRPESSNKSFAIGIPYAVPTRYVVTDSLDDSSSELSAMLLTGVGYGLETDTANAPP